MLLFFQARLVKKGTISQRQSLVPKRMKLTLKQNLSDRIRNRLDQVKEKEKTTFFPPDFSHLVLSLSVFPQISCLTLIT